MHWGVEVTLVFQHFIFYTTRPSSPAHDPSPELRNIKTFLERLEPLYFEAKYHQKAHTLFLYVFESYRLSRHSNFGCLFH